MTWTLYRVTWLGELVWYGDFASQSAARFTGNRLVAQGKAKDYVLFWDQGENDVHRILGAISWILGKL